MTKRERVVVWGTFDIFHQGHLEFLKESANLGELHVIVVPDKAVLENKGRLPENDQHKRREQIASLPFVKSCLIDSLEDGLPSISQIKPTIFCLGYDQTTEWEEKIKEYTKKNGQDIKFMHLSQHADGIHSRFLRGDAKNL